MLEVRSIVASSLSRNSVTLDWTYASTTDDLATWTVYVLRSESWGGPYQLVSPGMVAADHTSFTDRGVNLLSKFRDLFWRIRAVNGGTTREFGSEDFAKYLAGDITHVGGVTLEAPPDMDVLEARDRIQCVLSAEDGREVVALNRKSYGQYCPDCYNMLQRRRTRSRCETCFDTSYAGGYWRPQRTRMMEFNPDGKQRALGLMELEPNQKRFMFNYAPRLGLGDVVVEIRGKRWRVDRIDETDARTALVYQLVTMHELSKDQIEYDIPIRGWNVNSLTAGPLRRYLQATDIDSYYAQAKALGLTPEETP